MKQQNDRIKELERELEENKELIEELEGDVDADEGDEFRSGHSFGKYMMAKGKQEEILNEINKIKKEQGL
ncbi:MAG: hypothetical protein H8D31_00450 [Nitrosopumilus sp.]|nr:hypothetical protein [Nitrosopumilus sp.]